MRGRGYPFRNGVKAMSNQARQRVELFGSAAHISKRFPPIHLHFLTYTSLRMLDLEGVVCPVRGVIAERPWGEQKMCKLHNGLLPTPVRAPNEHETEVAGRIVRAPHENSAFWEWRLRRRKDGPSSEIGKSPSFCNLFPGIRCCVAPRSCAG